MTSQPCQAVPPHFLWVHPRKTTGFCFRRFETHRAVVSCVFVLKRSHQAPTRGKVRTEGLKVHL